MTETTPRIAGAGICCLDHIVTAPQIPWGESGWVTDYFAQGGGLVATALVACSRLGAECELFSFLGEDWTSNEIIAGLREEGVGLGGVMRIPGAASPFSFIHVAEGSGDRTIFHRRASGVNDSGFPDISSISQYDALLIDDYYPHLALAAAKTARANGVPVIADVTPDPQTEILRYVDVLIAPKEFAAKMGFGDDYDAALAAAHELGPSTVVITLGAKGWVCSSPTGVAQGDAFDVKTVDTTGAGDSFHGAFAYAVARGWETERCAEFASAVAAIKCTMKGGRTGLPSPAQATEFLKTNGRLDWSDIQELEGRS